MSMDVDVVVVGAGPGGSSCAAALARKGLRVLVLEQKQFPRDKTCGDGLGSRIPSIFDQLGIDPAILDRFQPVRGLILTSPGGISFHGRFTAEVGRNGVTWVAPRLELDQLLRNHAETCGAEIREGVRVTGLIVSGEQVNGVVCTHADGREERISARVVVGADGEHSVVRRQIGAPVLPRARTAFAVRAYYEGVEGLEEAVELHYDRSFFPAYAWIFPVGEGRANVGCGAFDFWAGRRINLPQAMQQFLSDHPAARTRFKNARQVSPVKGWPLSMGNLARDTYTAGALLVGDAASLINPLTGEGIYTAMHSGLLAAEVIGEAIAEDDLSRHKLAAYEHRWRRCFGEDFRYSYLVRVMLGRFPWALDLIARKAVTDTTIATSMACAITGAISPKALLSPRFLARLLLPGRARSCAQDCG